MYQEILDFWFSEMTPAQWWKKDPTLDRLIATRFSNIHHRASRCELAGWRESARGRLAEIIILDQFSRNIYRDSSLSFANDALALSLAQHAVSSGADLALPPIERSFFYMPFMHSESLVIHQMGLGLFSNNAQQENLRSAIQHKEIIEKFGRYPHRNKILARKSTDEEIEFLKQPGSSF